MKFVNKILLLVRKHVIITPFKALQVIGKWRSGRKQAGIGVFCSSTIEQFICKKMRGRPLICGEEMCVLVSQRVILKIPRRPTVMTRLIPLPYLPTEQDKFRLQ